jgi:hypothetical protein
MTITSDLTGLGMAPALAGKVGHQVSTVAGVGTAASGAAKIGTTVTIGTTASGQTAFALPTQPTMGKEYYFFNTSATAALIFPPASGTQTLNGSTSSVSVAQNKGAMFMCVSKAGTGADQWLLLAGA